MVEGAAALPAGWGRRPGGVAGLVADADAPALLHDPCLATLSVLLTLAWSLVDVFRYPSLLGVARDAGSRPDRQAGRVGQASATRATPRSPCVRGCYPGCCLCCP
jgi:hypothetical protein